MISASSLEEVYRCRFSIILYVVDCHFGHPSNRMDAMFVATFPLLEMSWERFDTQSAPFACAGLHPICTELATQGRSPGVVTTAVVLRIGCLHIYNLRGVEDTGHSSWSGRLCSVKFTSHGFLLHDPCWRPGCSAFPGSFGPACLLPQSRIPRISQDPKSYALGIL